MAGLVGGRAKSLTDNCVHSSADIWQYQEDVLLRGEFNAPLQIWPESVGVPGA